MEYSHIPVCINRKNSALARSATVRRRAVELSVPAANQPTGGIGSVGACERMNNRELAGKAYSKNRSLVIPPPNSRRAVEVSIACFQQFCHGSVRRVDEFVDELVSLPSCNERSKYCE